MKKIYWMIFRPEAADVLFFWDGENLSIGHCDPRLERADWMWTKQEGKFPCNETSEADKALLNAAAAAKRQKLIVHPHDKRRFIIEYHGEYVYKNE